MNDTGRLSEIIPVIGYSPSGREVVRLLLAQGYHVRVIQRKQPDNLQEGASFCAADAMDSDQLIRVIA